MAKDDYKGGIIINIKPNPDDIIRERTKKFARGYVRVAFASLIFSIIFILLMAFWKDDIESHFSGEYDLVGLMTSFFNLDNQVQWAIVFGMNGWAMFAVALTLSFKAFVKNESTKWLKIWLVVDLFDCAVAIFICIILLYNVALVTKIFLGISFILAFLYEIYFIKTLLQFIHIISRSNAYEEDAYA